MEGLKKFKKSQKHTKKKKESTFKLAQVVKSKRIYFELIETIQI